MFPSVLQLPLTQLIYLGDFALGGLSRCLKRSVRMFRVPGAVREASRSGHRVVPRAIEVSSSAGTRINQLPSDVTARRSLYLCAGVGCVRGDNRAMRVYARRPRNDAFKSPAAAAAASPRGARTRSRPGALSPLLDRCTLTS